jgi:phosphoglycolate phosphatase-like HAD superfamily hydrolase
MKSDLALIFDLDGVVIDVRSTYRQAYVDGVTWALRDDAQLPVANPMFTVSDVHVLKRHPGFNAPRHTVGFFARACLVAIAAAGRASSVADGAVRQLVDDVVTEAGECDWQETTLRQLNVAQRDWVLATERGLQALRRTHEAYAGSANTRAVYGIKALGDVAGRCAGDRLLMDPRRTATVPVAVYTGRALGEAMLVTRQFQMFAAISPALLVTTDDGAFKPDPAPLAELIGALGAKRVIYIGDTAADRATVDNFNASNADRKCEIAQVVTPGQASPWPEAVVTGSDADTVLDALGV